MEEINKAGSLETIVKTKLPIVRWNPHKESERAALNKHLVWVKAKNAAANLRNGHLVFIHPLGNTIEGRWIKPEQITAEY